MKPHSILAHSLPKTSSAVSPEQVHSIKPPTLRSGFLVKSPPIFQTSPPHGAHISRCINMQRSLPRFRSVERFFSCKIHGKMFYPNSLCLMWRCQFLSVGHGPIWLPKFRSKGSNSGVDAICGLSLFLFLSLAPRGFFSGYSGFLLSSKTNTSKFQFDLERTETCKRVHMNS